MIDPCGPWPSLPPALQGPLLPLLKGYHPWLFPLKVGRAPQSCCRQKPPPHLGRMPSDSVRTINPSNPHSCRAAWSSECHLAWEITEEQRKLSKVATEPHGRQDSSQHRPFNLTSSCLVTREATLTGVESYFSSLISVCLEVTRWPCTFSPLPDSA